MTDIQWNINVEKKDVNCKTNYNIIHIKYYNKTQNKYKILKTSLQGFQFVQAL